MLMLADRDGGFILGAEAMTAETSLTAMRASIPDYLAKMLLKSPAVPRRLMVRSEWLRNLLKTLTQSLNIELRHSDELPSIDEAIKSMSEWTRTGKV